MTEAMTIDDSLVVWSLPREQLADRPLVVLMHGRGSHEQDLAGLIPGGDDHYVVIMTFGYRTDDLALRALMPKSFRFLGVLGSRSKIKQMFDGYRREGMAPERLSQVYAPVGLAINSRTPEEIAVSIAAQLIGIKNQAQDIRQQVAAGRGNRKH